MGRIMALDYGTKRTGIAVTDVLRIIANPLTTVHTKDLLEFLTKYFQEEEVDILVVGEPTRLNGEQDKIGKIIDDQVIHFGRKFKEMEIVRENEQFTSKLAKQSIHMMGGSKKMRQDKGVIDKVSATIILQSYMQSLP
jgi:putative holliday junction resolvase